MKYMLASATKDNITPSCLPVQHHALQLPPTPGPLQRSIVYDAKIKTCSNKVQTTRILNVKHSPHAWYSWLALIICRGKSLMITQSSPPRLPTNAHER
eukprot:1424526-Pyramimonas_sp.AAC.1